MTNFDRWMCVTERLASPVNYIEWGYRYLIGAALQRRVWIGFDNQRCFPNKYVILVGPPGTGKGNVIKDVSECLTYWKLKDTIKLSTGTELSPQQKETHESVLQADIKNAQDSANQPKNKKINFIEPLLIPVAADATTYEALVAAVANSFRRINYLEVNGEQKQMMKVYGHSSLCFSLQELGSLLRKRTEDTVNYMLGLYDCPETYEYDTKTQGKDMVKRGCLNLLAGTTPSFMESIFSASLVDEGFSSRTFAIFAQKNRRSQFFIPALTVEQHEHKKILLEHIRKLTSIYGEIKIDSKTKNWLEDWIVKYESNRTNRSNKSAKLDAYYARKNIHVMKVAIAEHFSESTELFIPLETFEKAIDILDKEEKTMDHALMMNSANPTANLARRILDYLELHGKKNSVEIVVDMFSYGNKPLIEEALSYLLETDKIGMEEVRDEQTEKLIVYYYIK